MINTRRDTLVVLPALVSALAVFVAACAANPPNQSLQPETLTESPQRDITLTVTVTAPDRKPLPKLGLTTIGGTGAVCGTTDEKGTAMLRLRVGNGPARILIVMTACGGTAAAADDTIAAMLQVERQYGVRHEYPVQIPALEANVHHAINLEWPVKLEGRSSRAVVTRMDGGPPGSHSMTGKRFWLTGVPKGQACELVVTANDGPINIMSLTPNQTQADIDLGDIAEPSLIGTTPVSLTVTVDSAWPSPPEHVARGMATLIRTDRGAIFEGPFDANGVRAGFSAKAGVKPILPQGKYYVSLGKFGMDWIGRELWAALKRPDAVQFLEQARWPQISVPADGSVEAKVSMSEILAAARRVRGF